MQIDILLKNLLNRLPELEWQLEKLNITFSHHLLPPGLFQLPYDAPAADYVKQLRDDIRRIDSQKEIKSTHYLVGKINQKVNVLVNICRLHGNAQSNKEVSLTFEKLSTRQEWLVSLEQTIKTLNQQKQALTDSLNQRLEQNQEARINLQFELGLIEKKITLAKESYYQTTGIHYGMKDRKAIFGPS